MRRSTIVALLVAVAGLAYPSAAPAGELVRFHDGRYLEVEGHEVRGNAVRLTIDSGAVVAFSAGQVEWIERAGMRVFGERVERSGQARAVVRDAGSRRDPEVREVARDFPARARRGARPVR